LSFHEQGVDRLVIEHFGIEAPEPDLAGWSDSVARARRAERTVRIALVGKYVKLEDAYLSVCEALRHAAHSQDMRVQIDWVDSEQLEPGYEGTGALEVLSRADGILIPGGFGGRGVEGKIAAARFARERSVPFLGICLGMHIAVAEFARNVAGMEGANSTEFDHETPFPVIDLLPEQKEVAGLGGTMRLGADPIKLHEGSRARAAYGGEAVVYERHRHRYEVNNLLRKRLTDLPDGRPGLRICGTTPDERLVEAIELGEHPFFVASQFHPEFKSRPERPAPLFAGFIAAAAERTAGPGREGERGSARDERAASATVSASP
ncbi:MAG: CTP synthase, partial [Acidobacteriota bacterium]|nr:CTP synthase [Acidobacteriota bacterium]